MSCSDMAPAGAAGHRGHRHPAVLPVVHVQQHFCDDHADVWGESGLYMQALHWRALVLSKIMACPCFRLRPMTAWQAPAHVPSAALDVACVDSLARARPSPNGMLMCAMHCVYATVLLSHHVARGSSVHIHDSDCGEHIPCGLWPVCAILSVPGHQALQLQAADGHCSGEPSQPCLPAHMASASSTRPSRRAFHDRSPC